jgi:hypothetical protein
MRNAECRLRNDNPFPAIAAMSAFSAFPGEAGWQKRSKNYGWYHFYLKICDCFPIWAS